MSNIAVIGDHESTQAFRALGFDTYGVSDLEAARVLLHRLARQNTAVIFITEQLAEALNTDIHTYQGRPAPAIILIPGAVGSLGIALSQIDTLVEKAVGRNILKEKDEASS